MVTISVGKPVLHSDAANFRFGVVAEVNNETYKAKIAWLSDGVPSDINRDVPFGVVESYLVAAQPYNMPTHSVEETAEITKAAFEAWNRRLLQAEEARQRRFAETAAFQAELKERAPEWAKAVLIGELHENVSDSQSDYFASKTKRVLILAWSKHTRDIFSEMRKAAKNAAETSHLADTHKEAEHREKWSMGDGYFLSATGRYSGWKVRKCPLTYTIPTGEWRIP